MLVYCQIKIRWNKHIIWIRLDNLEICNIQSKGRCGSDRRVVGFTTTYTISAYHHWCCEFESRSGQGVQQYVIKVRQWLATGLVFSSFLHQYNWNIVESGIKLHQTFSLALYGSFSKNVSFWNCKIEKKQFA